MLATNETALLGIVSDHGSSLSGPRSADPHSRNVAVGVDSLRLGLWQAPVMRNPRKVAGEKARRWLPYAPRSYGRFNVGLLGIDRASSPVVTQGVAQQEAEAAVSRCRHPKGSGFLNRSRVFTEAKSVMLDEP